MAHPSRVQAATRCLTLANGRTAKRLRANQNKIFRPARYQDRAVLPASLARAGDENAARGVVEEGSADGALPPSRGKGKPLPVSEHDQVNPEFGRDAANLLHRLPHRQVARGIEALLLEEPDALVEDFLGALFFLFQQLLWQKALGQEQAGRHSGHGQEMRLRMDERGDLGAFQQCRASLARSVESHKDPFVHGYLPSSKNRCFTRYPCLTSTLCWAICWRKYRPGRGRWKGVHDTNSRGSCLASKRAHGLLTNGRSAGLSI